MEEEMKEALESVNEAAEEMKEGVTLSDVLNKRVKYAEREVETYLDFDASMEAFEIRERIIQLNNLIDTVTSPTYKSITDEEGQAEIAERDALVEELTALNDRIQESKAVWHVRRIGPKVWKTMDATARRKFPIADDASDTIKTETQLERNDWVNVETLKNGIQKVVFADGTTITNITREDAQNLYDNIPYDIVMEVKEQIEILTFANRSVHEELESADFLLNS